MLGRIHGLYVRDKNLNRNWTNAVMKYGTKLQADLEYLLEDRAKDYGERYESWRKKERQNDEHSDQPKPRKTDE